MPVGLGRSSLVLTLFAVAMCASTIPRTLTAQGGAAERDLADLDKRLQEAAVNGDPQLLERHLAPDFAFTHSTGNVDTKAHWVKLAAQKPPRYLARNVSDQAVEIHGDVGIVLGRLDVWVPPPPARAQSGPQCYALRFVHVYAKRDGRWMFLSHRTTQMIEESRPCGTGA